MSERAVEAFGDRLNRAVRARGNACVVGLDPMLEYIPERFFVEARAERSEEQSERLAEVVTRFCLAVIDAVGDLVPVVKPQSAFFELFGHAGVRALEAVSAAAKARGMLVLLDVKRGDVPSTAAAYARAYLAPRSDGFDCDAVTVNPYLGRDSLLPFFETARRHGKGVFVLAKTSNPGATDLQDQKIEERLVYRHVAELLRRDVEAGIGASGFSDIGFVVGATYPETGAELRRAFGGAWFLVPGVGAQGATAEAVRSLQTADGLGVLLSSSRSVLYPQRFGGASAWSNEAVRHAAEKLIAEAKR